VSPGLTLGSRVRAGEVIGYMGDSGNAEFSVPHLHFEIRTPDHAPVNPFHSLVAAQQRQTCTGDAGAWTNTPIDALSPRAVAVIPLADGGRWVIDDENRIYAGSAARQPTTGVDCRTITDVPPAAPAEVADTAPIAAPITTTGAAAQPGPSGVATACGTSCSRRTTMAAKRNWSGRVRAQPRPPDQPQQAVRRHAAGASAAPFTLSSVDPDPA
jgi:hypothetical protein